MGASFEQGAFERACTACGVINAEMKPLLSRVRGHLGGFGARRQEGALVSPVGCVMALCSAC
eukprot:15414949-Alexandrium_andersonii.AAC.1